jgi:hypothetical protein
MRRASLEKIVQALNDAPARFLVVGDLAVVIHGYLRFTADVDLALEPNPEARRRALRALSGLGYAPRVPVPIESFADAEQVRRWTAEKGMLAFGLHSETHHETSVDLLLEIPFDFESAYARARREAIAPDLVMTVLPRRELIEMKRAAGRPRDLDDIEALEIVGDAPEDVNA